MALSTRQGIPPDENYHLAFIRLFTDNGWLPFIHNQTGQYALGEVVHAPFFLYQYLLSLPTHIFIHTGHVVLFLRLINIFLGACSLLITYELANLMKLPKIVKNLSIFMLANTLMFVFVSSSINYGNLSVLLSLSSVLLLLLIKEKPSIFRVQLLAICIVGGLLTNINFLPIAFIVLVILVFGLRNNPRQFMKSLRLSLPNFKMWNAALAIVLIFLSLLFVQRYVLNLIRYHAYAPSCQTTLTLAQCEENPIFKRTERLDKTVRPPATKGVYQYISDWTVLMGERTYGIFSHKSVEPLQVVSIGAATFFLLGAIAFIRKYQLKDSLVNIMAVVTVFYMAALILDNFHGYQKYGSFSFAVQGRYLLPVLPLIYLILSKYIFELIKHKAARLVYVLGILLIFVVAGLPSYIIKTDPGWHNKRAININQHARSVLVKVVPH